MRRVLIVLVLLSLSTAARAQEATITADQWATPRSGQEIAAWPALKALVLALENQPSGRIVVHYASGDDASLWANELRSWLVALGVPSARIVLVRDLPSNDRVVLDLRSDGGGN